MKKIVVLFKKNIEKIYRVQIFLFILFILTSILFNLDSQAHKYYNNSIIDYNFHSVFAIFMLLLFGLFFWISIIYPFVCLIQLVLIYNYKASFSKKMRFVTISILLYIVTLICLLSLYFIERHQEFNERRNQEFIERSTIEKYKMNPSTNTSYPNNYEGKMPYCDWISFASIRDQENNVRDFDGEDDFSFDGATLPNEIEKLMKGILGYKNVVDNTNMITNKGTLLWDGEDSSSREIAKMSELRNKGYAIVMFINTNMIKQDEVKFTKNKIKYIIKAKEAKKSGVFDTFEHWVVFEEVIGGTITWDEYDFKVFTWGEIMDVIINPEVFSTNYYGYVYGK